MTRTATREIAVQILFAVSQTGEPVQEAIDDFFDKEHYATLAEEDKLYKETPTRRQLAYISDVVNGVLECQPELDERIEKYSRGWKLSRISHIAVTILRTAIYEVLYVDDVPDAVAVNEAVELSKGYEDDETVSFINGILGSFIRTERTAQPAEDKTETEETADKADAPNSEQEEQ